MDTTRWKRGDEFPVLDLLARFRCRSASSLSFELCKLVSRDSPKLPELENGSRGFILGGGPTRVIIGWLDIHHPCDGYHQLQLRVGLPDRYLSWESLRDLAPQVITALGLPADESYHILLAGVSRQISTAEPQTAFVDTTHWKPSN